MKSPRGLLTFLASLFVLPLPVLGACSDPVLPSCARGQVLLTGANGALTCSTMADVPDTQVSDDSQIHDRLTALEQTVQQMQAVLRALSGRPSSPVFVGTTTQQHSGLIDMYRSTSGLNAAAKACTAEFGPNAQLCTPYDIYRSLTTGMLAESKTIALSWVYFPAWEFATNFGPVTEPEDGLADTCGNYGYEFHSHHWHGVLVQRSALPTGPIGFYYYGNLSYDQLVGGSCTNIHPLACCQ